MRYGEGEEGEVEETCGIGRKEREEKRDKCRINEKGKGWGDEGRKERGTKGCVQDTREGRDRKGCV